MPFNIKCRQIEYFGFKILMISWPLDTLNTIYGRFEEMAIKTSRLVELLDQIIIIKINEQLLDGLITACMLIIGYK
ncbi:hypothetical protein D3C85_1668290 [compost metagenome]